MTAFLLSLAAVAGVLLAASSAGWLVCRALFPVGSQTRAERAGWSLALGCALLAAVPPVVFILGVSPGWIPFLLGGSLMVAGARLLPLPTGEGRGPDIGFGRPTPKVQRPKRNGSRAPLGFGPWTLGLWAALLFLVLLGVALYTLRALTEPMWSNDFLAIWGFKGKTIFFSRSLPSRFYDWSPIRFSHPEYPLGLPFLYAGVSFLTGSWDDHAMALLFLFFHVATLCALFGWLRRCGASREIALSAAALVALFEPLYSAFLTGMAEVPLAFCLLLYGMSLCDSLDETDAPSPDGLRRASSGAVRRLAFASLFVAAVKNEGLFLAGAGFAIALLSGGSRRLKMALAAFVPALAVYALHVAWRGRAPLSDFDFGRFSAARVAEALGAAVRAPGLAGWLGLAALGALIACGSRSASGDRLLLLAACGLAAYVVLPVFAVRGPAWLVETTLLRTASALLPLVAAGVAVRLCPAFTAGASI